MLRFSFLAIQSGTLRHHPLSCLRNIYSPHAHFFHSDFKFDVSYSLLFPYPCCSLSSTASNSELGSRSRLELLYLLSNDLSNIYFAVYTFEAEIDIGLSFHALHYCRVNIPLISRIFTHFWAYITDSDTKKRMKSTCAVKVKNCVVKLPLMPLRRLLNAYHSLSLLSAACSW